MQHCLPMGQSGNAQLQFTELGAKIVRSARKFPQIVMGIWEWIYQERTEFGALEGNQEHRTG